MKSLLKLQTRIVIACEKIVTNLVVADFSAEIFGGAFTRNVFPISKREIPRTVRLLGDLDVATRKGLTFPQAVDLF